MYYALFAVFVVILALVSLLTGVSDVSVQDLFVWTGDARPTQILLVSRVPRTLALILAGSALAITGTIMQMLARNRFVEPSTVGTAESAALGLLVATIFMPGMPVIGKMAFASVFALMGTALFLLILSRVPHRQTLLVPLIGLMLGGVVGSITTFFAYRYDLLQSILAWTMGDFSGVIRGRYELLWLGFILVIAAYFTADRFTVAGMGKNFATNLGVNYQRALTWGLVIVSLVTASVVVSVGMVPFLGLIIPNVVSMIAGDNLRKTLPWIGLSGAGFVLASDIVGRLVRFPYEMPVATIAGVVGSAVFLLLLLRRRGGNA